ncbi:hypothetical protein KBD87_04085 [Candidatus Saccharibacteria bacterium]|nr:hypothetical protein [Candidatus Saccharibacteria bacterium]
MDQSQASTPSPMPQTQAAPQPAVMNAAPSSAGEPRSYLTMVVLAFFTGPMGLARWYRGEDSGKVRFWVYLVVSILSAIPFVNFVAIPIMLVLVVWGVVDFFLLHGTSTDASNMPLVTTNRDRVWAKNLKVAYIICLILGVLAMIAAVIVIALVAQNGLQQRALTPTYDQTQTYQFNN